LPEIFSEVEKLISAVHNEVLTLGFEMGELDTIIGGLSAKVVALGERQRLLVSENERLKQQNQQMERELADQKNTNLTLREQQKIAKIARSVGDAPENRKEERKLLNDMVREIDKCIALLNN
jgi:cell division protein FtsL